MVPLLLEELTYIGCIESRLAFVSAEERSPPMQFFAEEHCVTALAFHEQRKLLAACADGCVVYKLGQMSGKWVASKLARLSGEAFRCAAFSPDAQFVVCATSTALVGYDWKAGRVAFEASASIRTLAYHPTESLELATSGAGLKLWRLLHKNLKARPPVEALGDKDFSTHAWLPNELLVAGTTGGSVVVVQRNEMTQRFDSKHTGSVQAIVPLEGSFASVCEDAVACVFVQAEKAKKTVSLSRRVVLEGLRGLYAMVSFPRSTATLACCRDGLAFFDVADLLLVTTGPDLQTVAVQRLPSTACHEGPVRAMGTAQAKPLVVACSSHDDKQRINVWDWRVRGLIATSLDDDETLSQKTLASLDVHPTGHEVLAGFQDAVCLYHVSDKNLVLAQSFHVRGVVKLPKDVTPLVATTSLSLVKYSRTGCRFAAVTGRLVQIFSSVDATGRPSLVHCLRGHAADVRAIAFSPDDLGVWTASDDGAVYSWTIGDFAHLGKIVTRSHDFVRLDVLWEHLAAFNDGGLAVLGRTRTHDEQRATTRYSIVNSDAKDASMVKRTPVILTWKTPLDGPGTPLPCDDSVDVTCAAAIDDCDGLPSVLIVGTSRGSVLVFTWSGESVPIREIPACDGRVAHLCFSWSGRRLIASGETGTILVCTSTRDSTRDDERSLDENDMILVDRSALNTLENNVRSLERQLDQAKLEAEKQVADVKPYFEREMEKLRTRHRGESQLCHAELDASRAAFRAAEANYERRLSEVTSRYEASLDEMAMIYERKLAHQAARYMEIQEERDRVAFEASESLAEHQSESVAKLLKQEKEAETKVKDRDREVNVLHEYVAHAKRQFQHLFDEQDARHEVELAETKDQTAASLNDALKARQAALRDNAKLKRDNMDLKESVHKTRDELIECQQALMSEQSRCEAKSTRLATALEDLDVQTKRATKFEEASTSLEKRVVDLEKLRDFLKQRQGDMTATIQDKDTALQNKTTTLAKLDSTLEDAGLHNKKLDQKLQLKVSELRRVTAVLNDCRNHICAKDKILEKIHVRFDMFLIKLRDPDVRPRQSVVAEIEGLRDAIAKLHASRPNDLVVTPDEPRRLKPVVQPKHLKSNKLSAANADRAHAERTVQQLRGQNLELMSELNELRFDRLSLHRKLRDANCQIRWGERPRRDSNDDNNAANLNRRMATSSSCAGIVGTPPESPGAIFVGAQDDDPPQSPPSA